jgi:CubicO group peptidase (beta-lactamase class C family)
MKIVRSIAFLGALVLQLDPVAASAAPVLGATSGAGVDAYLQSLVPFGFSGNAIVASRGKVLLAKAYGMADRGRNIPMRADTVISVGSITKQFTAAAILKLAEMGKLNVRDSIAVYLPSVPADKRPITLHELLTHTAGLQSDYGGDYEHIGRDAFVARVMAAPLESAPGSRFDYANAGYSLLAAIVERVSGMSYERFLHDHLFVPAGMFETGYRIPHWPASSIAIGYERSGEAWGTIEAHGWSAQGPYWNLMGNGGILSNPADMLRWSEALQQRRVLSDASVTALQTGYVDEPMGGRYGYGWDVETTPYGTLVSHNGGNGIFAAEFLRFVDSDTVVYVATNAAAVPAASLDLGLAAAAFGEKDPPAPVQDLARVPLVPQLAGDSITVPMLAADALPVVEVSVNGKGPYRFGIETGAPFVAIRESLAADLNLHAVARGEVPLYMLDTVSLPGLTFGRVPAIATAFRDPNIDGVFGLNAFDALLLTLDYPGRRVTFARGALPAADGKTILPAERVAFGYGIALDIGGYKTVAFVDTRSQTALSLSPAMAKRVSFESPLVVTGKAAGAGFAPTELRSGRIAGDVAFGAFSVRSPIASVVQLPPYLPQEALLGNMVLSHFVVTLDERSGLLRFLMPDGKTSVPKQE